MSEALATPAPKPASGADPRIARLEGILRKGIWRFVFLYGVLAFGLSMAVFMFCVLMWTVPGMSTPFRVRVALMVGLPMGLCMGLGQWFSLPRVLRRLKEQSGAQRVRSWDAGLGMALGVVLLALSMQATRFLGPQGEPCEAMLMISGAVLGGWGALKYGRFLWSEPYWRNASLWRRCFEFGVACVGLLALCMYMLARFLTKVSW